MSPFPSISRSVPPKPEIPPAHVSPPPSYSTRSLPPPQPFRFVAGVGSVFLRPGTCCLASPSAPAAGPRHMGSRNAWPDRQLRSVGAFQAQLPLEEEVAVAGVAGEAWVVPGGQQQQHSRAQGPGSKEHAPLPACPTCVTALSSLCSTAFSALACRRTLHSSPPACMLCAPVCWHPHVVCGWACALNRPRLRGGKAARLCPELTAAPSVDVLELWPTGLCVCVCL